MIEFKEENILNAIETIICHQVNCMGVMGSGLAKQIKNKYPEVYKNYKDACKIYEKIFKEPPLGACHVYQLSNNKYIANLFGQYQYGKGKHTDYSALNKCFTNLKIFLKHKKIKNIAIPYKIGCGLGGGDWDIVYPMIDEIFKNYNVIIYKYIK